MMLYDGGCKLCRWAARLVARIDIHEQVALLPLDDEEAGRLLASVPPARRSESWWLVLRDGMPIAGNRGGGIALLSELELTRPLGRALGMLRLSGLVDSIDDLVARHRSALGRLVPDGPAPRRLSSG